MSRVTPQLGMNVESIPSVGSPEPPGSSKLPLTIKFPFAREGKGIGDQNGREGRRKRGYLLHRAPHFSMLFELEPLSWGDSGPGQVNAVLGATQLRFDRPV